MGFKPFKPFGPFDRNDEDDEENEPGRDVKGKRKGKGPDGMGVRTPMPSGPSPSTFPRPVSADVQACACAYVTLRGMPSACSLSTAMRQAAFSTRIIVGGSMSKPATDVPAPRRARA